MLSKKRFIISLKFVFIVIFALGILVILPYTLSKYQSIASSNANVDIAFYVVSSNLQTENIVMKEIGPSTEPYVYTFTVSNFEGNKRLETKAKYKIKITSTTNIPYVYKLYSENNTADSILTNEIVEADQDEMYFRKMETNEYEFGFLENETNLYQLYIYYPEGYDTYEYQNIVENINITIDSKQVIEGD